jgi:hypothetical protein
MNVIIVANAGIATLCQFVPFQCSMSCLARPLETVSPSARASDGDSACSARKL